jgi:pimeloyl-ACP methyl ester carboxylesterase
VTSWIEVDGLRLRHLDVGPTEGDADGPPLLVIPGHTARIEGFEELAPLLARRRRVIVIDCPGSGASDKPVRRYDLRSYEDVLVASLDALGIERAVPVGGSLGGNLVLRLGHRFPERFERLVVWAPGSAWTPKPALAWITDHLLARTPLGRLLFWPTVRIQSRFWYEPSFPHRQRHLDETFAYYRQVMGPGFVAMYWGMAADQLRRSLFDLAPAIAQPTTLIWGDRDHGAGMGAGVARLAELLPDVELHVLEGRRHSLEAECPAELAELILAGC